jgi:hypothetical protein
MFSGVSAENIKENQLCVLCVSAVNIYLYKEEYVYIFFVALVRVDIGQRIRGPVEGLAGR